jgi:hypothetical protein
MILSPPSRWHQNEPAPRFASGDLLVGSEPIGERNRPIDHGWLECAVLEERREGLEHACVFGRIPVARVDAEQLGLVVVKIDDVDARTTTAGRCNRNLPPATSRDATLTTAVSGPAFGSGRSTRWRLETVPNFANCKACIAQCLSVYC